jgi:predicted PurR-regulated permease PerM
MTKDIDTKINNKLAIIVSVIFIVTSIVTVVLAFGTSASKIDNLTEKTNQLCEEQKKLDDKKVDKAIYDIDIKYIKDGISEIKAAIKDNKNQ